MSFSDRSRPFGISESNPLSDSCGIRIRSLILLMLRMEPQQTLKINSPKTVDLRLLYFPAGKEFPEKSNSPAYKAVGVSIEIHDESGNIVRASSKEAADFMSGERGIVFVYGRLKYSDFSGSHNVRFCNPLLIMKAGTSRQNTKNEDACGKYNHQDDQYTDMPKIASLAPVDAPVMNTVTYIKPKER